MKPAQASSTAKVIAASTILLASDPRSAALVAPGAAELCQVLLSGSRGDRWLAKSAGYPLTRAAWRCLERVTLPGIMAHYWHRKRWIESRCRQAIAEGFERVMVLGAGLDTLGLRLAGEMRHIDVIEIDHPATQDTKRRALAHPGVPHCDNFRLIARDFSAAPLPELLCNDGTATMVVIEGVLMYLSAADIARLFDALHQLPAGRTRIVFSFMTKWPDGRSGFRPYSWLIERWLAWRGEPFTWSLDPDAMTDFLAMNRFRLLDMARTRQFSAAVVTGVPVLEGENLVLCEPVRRD